MKSSIVALVSFSAALALAQPHNHQHQHQHQKHHAKRAIVWTTTWEIVTETIDITTTIWVDGNATPAPETTTSTSTTITSATTTSTTTTPVSTTSVSTTSSAAASSQTPAEFHESTASLASTTSASEAPYVAPAPVSSSSAVAVPPSPPSPGPTLVGPVEQPLATASPAPAEQPAPSTSPAPVDQPANTSLPSEQPSTTTSPSPIEQEPSTPAYVPPTTTEVPAAPVATTAEAAAAASTTTAAPAGAQFEAPTGPCTPSSPCTGDMTYYQAGLGACGVTNDGDTDMVIALPVGLMGSLSNDNPYCGKTVLIINGAINITATVVDKCMGCQNYAIDLSNAAFLGLGEQLAVGRKVIEWYFTD